MGTTLRLESLASGQTLASRYQLDRPLQVGEQVATWLADDLERVQPVVLKLVVRDDATWAALVHEQRMTAAIAHPRVLQTTGPMVDGELAFLVADFQPAGTLAQWRGKPWRASAPAILGLLDALEATHAQGLVHRDLKPDNVVLDRSGAALLTDFGTAARVGDGAAGGSPFSRSPAQARGAPATIADDLYGLGALLHEVLTGYPPQYPAGSTVEAIHVPQATPPAVLTIVQQLLSTEPTQRPSLVSVRQTIEHELREPAVESGVVKPVVTLVPPPRAAEPVWKPAATTGPVPLEPGGQRRPRWLIATAASLGVGLIGVLFVLPRWVDSQSPALYRRAASEVPIAPPTPSPAKTAEPLPTSPEALQALAEQKTQAEDARSQFEAVVTPLRAQSVASWASDLWSDTETAGTSASGKYALRDYAGAALDWQRGVELAAAVKAARTPALQHALLAGRGALAKPDAKAAVAAFQQALAIQPGQAEATAGLKRAQSLDQVLALVDEGAAFERARQWQQAGDRYRSALAMDALTPAAHAGLARVAQQINGAAFAAAMATGLRAAAANDRAGARAAFARAESLRPGSSEVRDARAALDGNERTERLARLKVDALAAERAERWADALKAYDAALELDTTVVFAQEGHARVQPRADVASRLDAMLARPERLTYATVREEARALLVQAARWSEGPVFKQQRDRIEGLLRAAETPVRVALESDNLTDVVVYRVGRLGLFDRQELQLLPGKYTIVGKRAGFRDVRREVEIPPGTVPPPVTVRCEERI